MSLPTFISRCAALLLAVGALPAPGAEAADGSVMYRCPGNDYNNTITAAEAEKLRCKKVENAPVTVIQSPATGASAASAAPPARPVAAVASVATSTRLARVRRRTRMTRVAMPRSSYWTMARRFSVPVYAPAGGAAARFS